LGTTKEEQEGQGGTVTRRKRKLLYVLYYSIEGGRGAISSPSPSLPACFCIGRVSPAAIGRAITVPRHISVRRTKKNDGRHAHSALPQFLGV
jgi:hypothetical protein